MSLFAKDQMLFFSRFHPWHARKRAHSIHCDTTPIDWMEVLTHAAVKKSFEGEGLSVLQKRQSLLNEKWPEVIGRGLKSDGRSDGREIGESDEVGCGRRQVRRACFINNGDKQSQCNGGVVIRSKHRIEAKHFKKALRWAYK